MTETSSAHNSANMFSLLAWFPREEVEVVIVSVSAYVCPSSWPSSWHPNSWKSSAKFVGRVAVLKEWSVHELQKCMEEEAVDASSSADKVTHWTLGNPQKRKASQMHYGVPLGSIRWFNKYKFIGIQTPLVLFSYLQKKLSKLCGSGSCCWGFNLDGYIDYAGQHVYHSLQWSVFSYHLGYFLREIHARMPHTWGPVKVRSGCILWTQTMMKKGRRPAV